jgi:hypothetical protein
MTLAKLGRVVRLSYQNWRMILMGASESFMNHPASVRCWPIREAWEADSSVSFGGNASTESGLSDCMRL